MQKITFSGKISFETVTPIFCYLCPPLTYLIGPLMKRMLSDKIARRFGVIAGIISLMGIPLESVQAQDTAALHLPELHYELEQVEVTGSRVPLTLGQSARMVTILDREAIASAPVQSIPDLLKYAVGIDVRQRGPAGTQTDISIRGGSYEQITLGRRTRPGSGSGWS